MVGISTIYGVLLSKLCFHAFIKWQIVEMAFMAIYYEMNFSVD